MAAQRHHDTGEQHDVLARRAVDRLLYEVPLAEAVGRTGLAPAELEVACGPVRADGRIALSQLQAGPGAHPGGAELLGTGTL